MSIFGREPAFIVGLVGSCVVAIVQTFAAQGVITNDQAQTVVNVVGVLVPVIAGIVARFWVYSPATVAKIRAGKA